MYCHTYVKLTVIDFPTLIKEIIFSVYFKFIIINAKPRVFWQNEFSHMTSTRVNYGYHIF